MWRPMKLRPSQGGKFAAPVDARTEDQRCATMSDNLGTFRDAVEAAERSAAGWMGTLIALTPLVESLNQAFNESAARITAELERACPCDDPECELPDGRCYLCGTPTPKASHDAEDHIEFTVGECCFAKVRSAYERLSERCIGRCCDECPGWFMANGDDFTYAEIQRCDNCGLHGLDDEAAMTVASVLDVIPAHPEGW